MKESDRKFIKSWEGTKKRGFRKYLLSHGLVFGIIVGITNVVLNFVDSDATIVIQDLVIKSLFIIISSGLIYGIAMWYVNNYIYHQKLNN